MSRFDRAFGPFGWKVDYAPAQVSRTVVDENGQVRTQTWTGFVASIQVRNPETGEWVTKQDAFEASDTESLEGVISGALKEAAVVWGIGRELYDYPRILVEGEHQHIPPKVLEHLEELSKAVAEGKPLPKVIRLSPLGVVVEQS